MPKRSWRLVGRDEPLARLRAALDQAGRGQRMVVVVEGESGIGKTALIRAATDGLPRVAWGTCIEDAGAAGYWAWSQALEELARQVGIDEARRLAGEDAVRLAALAPVFGAARSAGDSDRDRLLLFDAVGRWLEAASTAAPAVVVVDDLQWADASTAALVEAVARSPRPAALALIISYRPDELPATIRSHLGRLATVAERVALGGIDRVAVASLVEAVGGPTSEAVIDDIYRRGGGHPVFTRELALLDTTAVTGGLPGAVRDVIDRRVRRLPEATRRVLEVAALAGNELHPDVPAAVLGETAAAVAAAAAPALEAGVLSATGDGRTRFTHDLYRETLASSIEPGERPALHRAIGIALEDRAARGGEIRPAELARHFCAAVALDGASRAAQWARAAAEADCASLAFAEAAAHLRRWRQAVADAGITAEDDLRLEVLLCEADALARGGAMVDARGLLRVARDLAVARDAAGWQARTALAVAHLGARFSVRRDDVIAELDEARGALVGRDAVLEARLTATLARELQHSVAEDRPRAGPLSETALALGRQTGDTETLRDCLLARHDVLWTPGQGAARAEVAREIAALAERTRDDEHRAEGLLLLANALLEEGSAAFLPSLESCLELLDRLGEPRHRYLAETRRAALSLLRAELDEAATRIDNARVLGEHIREPDTTNVWMSQRLELVRATGRPEELAVFAADAVAHWTGAPIHAHAVAAGFLARAGDAEGARRHMATVADLGGWRTDRSYLWSVFVRELAIAAIALHDEPLCVELLADLDPLGATCGVNGALVAFAGSHAHTAGLLATHLGRDGRAQLSHARATYQRVGAPGWFSEVEQALSPAGGGASTRVLRRQGKNWHISFRGRHAVVPHAKGLGDLAVLLAKPGQDIHVLDLYASPDRSGPAGELADRQALLAFRGRLADIDDELAEAAAHHDTGRQAQLDHERESLLEELRRITRHDRSGRPFATFPAERARKAVAARLRDTIRRLEADLPELAAHLDRTILTGTYCRYRAEDGESWQIDERSMP